MDPDERVPRIGELTIRVKPDFLLKKAQAEESIGDFPNAFRHYVDFVESLNTPDDIKLNELFKMTDMALKLGAACDEVQDDEQTMKLYVQMLNFFPKNALILNALGVYLFAKDEHNIARKYLLKAATEGYFPAEKNLLHCFWHLIPRWHFRMLNDTIRNDSYKRAIHKAVRSGYKNVFDIGVGTGILSLTAATSQRKVKVTGFEENKTMFQIAKDVLTTNKTKNVTIYNENSGAYAQAPARCNLIVSEIFDAGFFGENCIQSLYHAINTFPNNDNFKVIPAGARLYVTGFNSERITSNYHYMHTCRELGIDRICMRMTDPGPYDTEFLANEKVQYLTNTKAFLDVDFYNKNQLYTMLVNKDSLRDFELQCTEPGVIHAFAVWFDLRLDEQITLTTNPNNANVKCWEQAVFNLDHPLNVLKNEILHIKPRLVNSQLNFTLLSHKTHCRSCFQVSKDVITFLNDKELTESIIKLVDSYRNYDLKVLDMHAFPLFGILMAKKGATVYHMFKEGVDLTFYQHLINVNKIPSERFIFIYEKSLGDYMIYLESLDVVFMNYVASDGAWTRFTTSHQFEKVFQSLVIPRKIFLKAQLIQSDYLDFCNKVDDERALGFNIAQHMNEFVGTEHPNLDSHTFERDELSEVVTFDISNLDTELFDAKTEASKNGIINGIFYWFEVHYTDKRFVFNTLNSTFHSKVCSLVDPQKEVKQGDKVNIFISREDSFLKVYCD